ncbi:MAG: glycosyltransferase [Clostridia bacterium]
MYIVEVAGGLPSEKYPLIGIFELDQAKALSEIGNKVIYLSIDLRSLRRQRKFGFSKTIQKEILCYNYSFPLGRVPTIVLHTFNWIFFKKLYKKIVKENGNPDILHAHFGRNVGNVVYKAKEKFKINYIITEHDSSIQDNLIAKWEKKSLKKIYHNSVGNIAVSLPFKNVLEHIYNENFKYVPNIVDLSSFSIPEEKQQKDGVFKFISVGNLNKGKNMAGLIDSFYELCNRGYDCTLDIIGRGEEKGRLEKKINDLQLQKKVFLRVQLSRAQINKAFLDKDCFALASKRETFGVVYIEAMAAGLPVVATICGGPEGFINEKNGLLVDVGDGEQLINALESMIKDRQKYDKEEIRQFCVDNFSADVVANKIIEVINA